MNEPEEHFDFFSLSEKNKKSNEEIDQLQQQIQQQNQEIDSLKYQVIVRERLFFIPSRNYLPNWRKRRKLVVKL